MSSKSSFSNSTSQSYGVVLHELAEENSVLKQVEDEVKGLKKLLGESSDFREMILSPTITKENKKNVMSIMADKNNFSKILKRFLIFLAIKNRLFFLGRIIESFLNLASIYRGELKAKLISSKGLSLEEIARIQKDLSTNFKTSLNISYEHNPDLIGGLTIQVGSIMVDTSIKTKLEKLEKNMVEAQDAN